MPFYGEAMHMRNMEMSFFVVCPLRNCECKAPKIGMNCNQSLIIISPFDSSRFSGQTPRIYKGIPKKDISMFHVKKTSLYSHGAPRASLWSPKTIPTFANLPSPAVAGFAKAGASVGHPPVSKIRRSMVD
jgi:hypothetical protein